MNDELKELVYDLLEFCDEVTDECIACATTSIEMSSETTDGYIKQYLTLHSRAKELGVEYKS